MATAFSFTRDGLLYNVHRFKQIDKYDDFLDVFIPPARSKPWVYSRSTVYGLIYHKPSDPARLQPSDLSVLFNMAFRGPKNDVTHELRSLVRAMGLDISVVTENGVFDNLRILGNYAPKDKILWSNVDNKAFPHFFRMVENHNKENVNSTFEESIKAILDMKFFGDFYHVTQPEWYTTAKAKWGSKGSD